MLNSNTLHKSLAQNQALWDATDVGYQMSTDGTSHLGITNKFYNEAMEAYSWRCAMSGFRLTEGRSTHGLRLVFLHWIQGGGRVSVDNVIVVNTLYADLFDEGVLTLSTDWRSVMAPTARMEQEQVKWRDPIGKQLALPREEIYRPAHVNIAWHNKHVFKNAS